MSATDLEPLVARAMARLRAPSSPERAQLVDLFIDAAMGRPVREAIDADRLVALTVALLDAERLERALSTLVRPAYERQRALLEKRGDRTAAWLPPGGEELLHAVIRGLRLPRGGWTTRVIDPADLRELLSPVLQETLLSFARKLPLVGDEDSAAGKAAGKLLGLARGLAHNAGERAGKIADLGRGVLGGLGSEMEKRMATAAREFSQGAFDPLEAAFVARLRSDDGQLILERMRSRAVREILATNVAELLTDLDAAPREPLDALAAKTLAFGAARPELAEMLGAEVASFVAAHEHASVGELLAAWGLRERVVAELRLELGANFARLTQTDAAEHWLRALLSSG